MNNNLPIPFDKREGIIFLNGEYVNWRDAKIHILTHALHYGSSCFEGLRIYDGKIFKNLEHAKRLLESAKMMDFKLEYSKEQIAEACIEVCKKNNVQNGYIRPIVWRGSEQMQVSARFSKIHFSIATWGWPSINSNLKKEGLNLIVGMYKRSSPECFPVFAKAGGLYVSSTLVKHEAENRGFHDCLMLDYRNYIAESSTSNFFVCFEDEIHTPIADCFLNGITRKVTMEIAKNLGYKVVERHIKLEELKNATDAFLTGTAAEISKVASVTERDLKTVYEFKSNKITKKLLEAYQEYVKYDSDFK